MSDPKYELPTTPAQPQPSYEPTQPMPLLVSKFVSLKARQVDELKRRGDQWVEMLSLPQQLLINSLIAIACFLTGAALYSPILNFWIQHSFINPPAAEQQK